MIIPLNGLDGDWAEVRSGLEVRLATQPSRQDYRESGDPGGLTSKGNCGESQKQVLGKRTDTRKTVAGPTGDPDGPGLRPP